jgi:hypothetical protein
MVAGAGVGRVARRRLDGRWINGVVAAGAPIKELGFRTAAAGEL